MKHNIILIGFMGCGKSSVGIRLSYHLKRTLIDTDKWIERRQGLSISEIFEKRGEEAFRRMETQCLEELTDCADNQIISVGGGLPVREENRRLLRQLGLVIYLKASPEVIYERIRTDTGRPLLQVENPLDRIKNLMAERQEAYASCADAVIDVSDKGFDEIIAQICKCEKEREEDENTGN